MKFIKKIIKSFKSNIEIVCNKCGWRTQETKMTTKLKDHCPDCKCTK